MSQTETVGDDIHHSSGAVNGNWTTASTIQRTITEGLSRDSNQTDRTEYRYDAGNQQFIPNTRTLIKTHTISDSATDDHGYSSQHDSQTSWYTGSFEISSKADVFDRQHWLRINTHVSSLNEMTRTDFDTGISTTSFTGGSTVDNDVQQVIQHQAEHVNKDGGTNPNFVRTITAKEDVTRTFNDKVTTTTAPDGSGGVLKAGNMTMTGAGNSWRYEQTGEQGTWDYTNYWPNQMMFESRPGFSVFVPHGIAIGATHLASFSRCQPSSFPAIGL